MAHSDPSSAQERVADYIDRVGAMAPIVRQFAEQADRDCRPAQDVVDAASDRGLFRLMWPRELGGGGLTGDEVPPIYEAMARIDGSAGWMLAIGQDRVDGSLSQAVRERLFGDPRARIAGSLNPFRVTAVPTEGGFLFTGIARYVSGCTFATWLSALGVWVDGDQRKGVRGILPMSECRVLETWNVVGLRGSGSHDVQFENVFVPNELIIHGGAEGVVFADSLAPVALGVAQHALDAFAELARDKVPTTTRGTLRERPMAQAQYGEAVGSLMAGRAVYMTSVAEARRRREAGEKPGLTEIATMRLAAVTAAKLAEKAVDLVFDAAGLSGPATTFDIERCWRDIHTMRQHVLLSTPRYELAGRILLGLESNSPII